MDITIYNAKQKNQKDTNKILINIDDDSFFTLLLITLFLFFYSSFLGEKCSNVLTFGALDFTLSLFLFVFDVVAVVGALAS